jgi:Fe2+ transport system protein B
MSHCKTCISDCHTAPENAPALTQVGGLRDYVVALAGNPNTGKSTVFNHLTGLRQHTGNWPGKTVARAEGSFTYNNARFKLVDLPGTYSLLAQSVDEEVARDFILFGRPDCTVVVCDATVLERNLHLVLQILEITERVVVCANLIDEADRKRIALEARAIERELGVPVVPTAAAKDQGLDRLMERVHAVASGQHKPHPVPVALPPQIESAIAELIPKLKAIAPSLPSPRWVAMRLLDGDESIERALRDGTLGELAKQTPGRSPTEAAA